MSNKTGTPQQRRGHLAMGNGGGGGGGGGEFELPQELLSVLPSDPYEQLDVARRITAMAVAARVSKLESETGKLRLKLAEKEHVIHGLQERVGDAESTLQETSARLSHALDEQVGRKITPFFDLSLLFLPSLGCLILVSCPFVSLLLFPPRGLLRDPLC
jgi:hypothetical protein